MAKENAAVILAVSDYDHTNPLSGCKNDGALIRTILEKTGKFAPDNTLYIATETTSGNVKGALSRFIEQLNGREVGEVFFFYTGHGLFDGTDFYYLLSDYSPAKMQVTTLSNAELDEMLRSLNAALVVKVIDACYSAQQYVKSAEEFEKAINAAKATYKHCYFMFSSEQTQPSWQGNNLSYFTLEFAKAIQQHSSPTIRYKDIIDFVSDSFATNPRQKPVFVAQANFTEEFCAVDEPLRRVIAGFLPSIASTTPATTTAPVKRPITEVLKEQVRSEAEQYCTEEEAVKAFEVMKAAIEGYRLPDPIEEFYTLRRTFMTEEYEVPNAKAIGNWLKNDQGDFFAKVLYTKEEYQAEERYYPHRGLLAGVAAFFPEYRTVTKDRDVVSGFDSTASIPFKAAHVIAEPKLQNVPWWKWYGAFIVSKTEIQCFVTHVRLKEINWKERQEQGKIEWRMRVFPMKKTDVLKAHLDELLTQFADTIIRYLMEKHGLAENGSAEPSPQAT